MSIGDVLLICFEGDSYPLPEWFEGPPLQAVELLFSCHYKDATQQSCVHEKASPAYIPHKVNDGKQSHLSYRQDMKTEQRANDFDGVRLTDPLDAMQVSSLRGLLEEHAGPFSSVAVTVALTSVCVATAALLIRSKRA